MDRPSGGWERPLWAWRGGEAESPDGLASRLDRALTRLKQMATSAPQGTGGVNTDSSGSPLSCALNPPSSWDALGEAELRLGTPLPADYTRFLLHADGAVLFETRGPLRCEAALLGTSSLIRRAEEMEGDYHARCIPELLVFATIGSDGDQLAFETGRMNPHRGCAVLDARRGYRPDQWWVMARDFTDWIERVLRDPGPPGCFARQWEISSAQPSLPLTDRLPLDPDSR